MKAIANDRISPEKAVEILRAGGLDVSLDQAMLILEFLYMLADITLSED